MVSDWWRLLMDDGTNLSPPWVECWTCVPQWHNTACTWAGCCNALPHQQLRRWSWSAGGGGRGQRDPLWQSSFREWHQVEVSMAKTVIHGTKYYNGMHERKRREQKRDEEWVRERERERDRETERETDRQTERERERKGGGMEGEREKVPGQLLLPCQYPL